MANLDSLPFEVFSHICLYLRASDLLALAGASKTLRHLLRAPIWKRRLLSLCPSAKFPSIKERRYPWARATFQRERFMRLFAHERRDALYYAGDCNTNNVIDVMHIPKVAPHILLVGDRGRTLSTFRIEYSVDHDGEPSIQPEVLSSDSKCHSGWIWSVDSYDRTAISGSWDGSFRVWSLADSGLSSLFTWNIKTAILCALFIDSNTVVAGLPNRQARVFDLRTPFSDRNGLRLAHRKAVISMACLATSATDTDSPLSSWLQPSGCGDHDGATWLHSESTVASSLASSISSLVLEMEGGEMRCDGQEVLDRLDSLIEQQQEHQQPDVSPETVQPSVSTGQDAVVAPLPLGSSSSSSVIPLFTGCSDHSIYGWDLRKTLTPVVQRQFDYHPRHLSLLGNGELWVAEPPNRIHLFDVRHGQLDRLYFNEVPAWPRGFGKLVATPGCVIACGLHGAVEAFHPTCPLVPMSDTPVALELGSQPTAMAVHDGVVALGTANGSIHLWGSRQHAM